MEGRFKMSSFFGVSAVAFYRTRRPGAVSLTHNSNVAVRDVVAGGGREHVFSYSFTTTLYSSC